MSDPGYDFFATGRPQQPAGSPALPDVPTPPPAAPAPEAFLAPAPAPARAFQMPNGTQVNQFGTPIGASAAPTGPYAAPGIGAVPTPTPGLVSTWAGPQVPAGHRAAARAVVDDRPPRNVRAVAILAIVLGALVALGTLAGFASYSTLSSQLDQLGGQAGLGAALLSAMLIGLVIMTVVAATLLVGGIATVAGQRWGGWILVVSFGLSLLGQVQSIATSGVSMSSVIGFLIGLVLLLVLVTGEGLTWLQGRKA